MVTLALLLGLLIASLGALGVVSPARLIGLLAKLVTVQGLYGIAALRVVVGVTLLLVAAGSRAPEVLRIFGLVALVSGLITPWFGVARFGRMVEWWHGLPELAVRLWSTFPLALGLFVAWAVTSVGA